MTGTKKNCLFCQIIRLEISAHILLENETVLAFKDIDPQAPFHALIIAKDHIEKMSQWIHSVHNYPKQITQMAHQLAKMESFHQTGYRMVMNYGHDGGQSVNHLHMHLLAGRALQWPPG